MVSYLLGHVRFELPCQRDMHLTRCCTDCCDADSETLVHAMPCRTNAKWVEMTSVHWYKATAEKDNTPATLLEEDQIRSEMENFKKIVEVSNRYYLECTFKL